MEVTEQDNIILDLYRGKVNTTVEQIRAAVERLDYYEDAEDAETDMYLCCKATENCANI